MKTVHIKKLWFGDETHRVPKVTLRSYWCTDAIKKRTPLQVVYNNESMTLTPQELFKPLSTRFVKSKIGKSDYELWDFLWNPEELET